MIQFDQHILQMGLFNHQLAFYSSYISSGGEASPM